VYHRASCIGILASGGHQDRVQMDTPLKGTSPNRMRCRHDRWTTRNDEGGLGRAKTPKASVGSIWEYKVDDDDSGVGPLDDRGACTPAAGVVEAGNIDALSTYPLLTLCGA
jgi:hypothetical protein